MNGSQWCCFDDKCKCELFILKDGNNDEMVYE